MYQHARLPLAIATLLALTGCGSLNNIRNTDRAVARSLADAEASAQAMKEAKGDEAAPVTILANKQYVNTKPIKLKRVLPTPCKITFNPVDPVTLFEAVQIISRACGVPARVGSDAAALVSGGAGQVSAGSASSPVGPQGIPLPPGISAPPTVFGAAPTSTVASPQTIRVSYTGPVEGLADVIASRFGVSWRVEDGAPLFFVRETRFFTIYNLPQKLETKSSISSGNTTTAGVTSGVGQGTAGSSGGGVSGENGSVQTTTLSTNANPVEDLTNTLKSMVGVGASYQYSSSTGTLVVSDTPDHLDRVAEYVDYLNTIYSKQVLVNVRLLSVTVSNGDSYGLNWTAVYTNLAHNYGIKLSNSYTATTGAVSGAINILSGNTKWNGSQVLVNALATQGKVRVLTEPSVLARNMKPTPIQVARQTGYLASAPGSSTATTPGSSVSLGNLQPGTVTTGFNMNVMPQVYPDNKTMELQLSINLSELVEIVRRESGDAAIETPTIDNKMFNPDVTLKSGETAIIASFKQESSDNQRSGVGSARNWLFGGGVTGKGQTTYIVIAISPVVLAENLPNAALAGAE